MTEHFEKQIILVVDDTTENIDVLDGILKADYKIKAALNGKRALKIASSENPPDLILLDIMMPEMDGYEVCRRLKEKEETKEIPVIFVTAKRAIEDEVKGLELGAVDYITKPVSPPVVLARVKTHLALKRQNEVLKENVRLREDIDRITRHDLKGPLTGVISLPVLIQSGGNLSEKQQNHLNKLVQLGYKMLDMINLSLDLYKMEQGIYQFQPIPVNVLSILKDIVAENSTLTNGKRLSVRITQNGEPSNHNNEFVVSGEKLMFYSMLSNIFKNALEASPKNEQITIDLEKKRDIKISIHNKGAVPVDIRERFFEKYVTAGKTRGSGLGTYSARLMAETQGGTVQLESSETEGTTVIFSFPD